MFVFILFQEYTDTFASHRPFFFIVVAGNIDSEGFMSVPSVTAVLTDVLNTKFDTHVAKLVASSFGLDVTTMEIAYLVVASVVGFLVASYLSMALSVCVRWYTRSRYESAWQEWCRVSLDGFLWIFCIPWNCCVLSRSCLTHTFTNRPRNDQ